MKTRKNRWYALLAKLLLPAAALAALLCFATALDSLDSGRSRENLQQWEETLRRGCTACYAAEGAYPPDLDYLKDHYGLQIDEERYVVRYTAFAENLIPDITVLEIMP